MSFFSLRDIEHNIRELFRIIGTTGSSVTNGNDHDHAGGDGAQIAYSGLSGLPTLGTAASKDIPAAGDASATEVVYGTDTRLTDARTPAAHSHAFIDLSDVPAAYTDQAGKAVVVNATADGLEFVTAATGAMATDTLWDAAGDLAIGTGANTGGKLAIGTANQVLRVNSGATAPEWATGLRIAKAHADAVQSVSTSPVRIRFDTVDQDEDSAITTGASWVFTAPRAGYYIFRCAVGYKAAVEFFLRWMLNGSQTGLDVQQPSTGGTWNSSKAMLMCKLAAGNTLYVTASAASGTADTFESWTEFDALYSGI